MFRSFLLDIISSTWRKIRVELGYCRKNRITLKHKLHSIKHPPPSTSVVTMNLQTSPPPPLCLLLTWPLTFAPADTQTLPCARRRRRCSWFHMQKASVWREFAFIHIWMCNGASSASASRVCLWTRLLKLRRVSFLDPFTTSKKINEQFY